MTIDLSFTKNEEWIQNRKLLWDPIGKDLSADLDKKVVGDIEHYFFNGIFRENGRISDPACMTWFPLQAPEGWNYVLQDLVVRQDVFESEFYRSLDSMDGYPITSDEELELWDYFHPKEFEPVVRSRIPVGRAATYVEVEVNPYRLLSKIAGGFNRYIRYPSQGLWPKWCQRQEYFFSTLAHFSIDRNKKYRKRDPVFLCYEDIEFLFTTFFWPERWADVEDPKQHREQFLVQFRDRIEAMPNLHEAIAELWEKAKTGELKKIYE